jgi:hypothetical protein
VVDLDFGRVAFLTCFDANFGAWPLLTARFQSRPLVSLLALNPLL